MSVAKFKLTSEPVAIAWPVTVNVPVDGGKIEKQKFTAKFLAEPVSDQRERWEKVAAARRDDELAALKAEDDMLKAIFVGWGDDVTDENGKPVAFDDDQRDKLLNVKVARVGVLEAYAAFIEGKRQKN